MKIIINIPHSNFYGLIKLAAFNKTLNAEVEDTEEVLQCEYLNEKRGTWEDLGIISGRHFWKCSRCADLSSYGESDFCPHCGADMRPTADEEILELFHLLSPSMKTAIHDIMEVTAGKADAKEKLDTMVHGTFQDSSKSD